MTQPKNFFIRLALVSVILLSIWLYLPPYADSFVGDDFVQQWRVRMFVSDPSAAYQIFNPFWTNWYYRPLQNMWFLGNRLQFGLNPFGYYFLQIGWHLLAVALVYRLVRQLHLPGWVGLFTAVLFAINGQHQLTVSWISSIAIVMGAVFSLAAATTYLSYLQNAGRSQNHKNSAHMTWLWLAAALIFCVLALLAHEEGFLAPLFLFALWLTQPKRPLVNLTHRAFFTVLLLMMAGYVVMQMMRPNIHIAVAGSYYTKLTGAWQPSHIGQFGLDVGARWAAQEGLLAEWAAQPIVSMLAALGLFLVLSIGFWYGSRAVRLGLLWAGLHAGFIYLGLWSQRPELFDGRHLYNAWIGMSIALGAALGQYWQQRTRRRPTKRQTATGLVVALLLFTGLHIWDIQGGMARFYQLTRLVQTSETQMKEVLPDVSDTTQVFATRFLLTPPYFVPAAGVWYGRPDLSGGSLDALKQHTVVTNDFYLFDYADGVLYNLMPELQAHQQTIFLWRQEPTTAEADVVPHIVAGPADDRRLAVQVTPTTAHATISFTETIPVDSQLATAVRGQPGQVFRVVAADEVLFAHTIQPDETGWVEALIPMNDHANHLVTIQLQLDGEPGIPAYWANPRLVRD